MHCFVNSLHICNLIELQKNTLKLICSKIKLCELVFILQFIKIFKTFNIFYMVSICLITFSAQYKCGDAVPIKLLPTGTQICSFEFYPGKGAQIARSAGNSCVIQRHIEERTIVKVCLFLN